MDYGYQNLNSKSRAKLNKHLDYENVLSSKYKDETKVRLRCTWLKRVAAWQVSTIIKSSLNLKQPNNVISFSQQIKMRQQVINVCSTKGYAHGKATLKTLNECNAQEMKSPVPKSKIFQVLLYTFEIKLIKFYWWIFIRKYIEK